VAKNDEDLSLSQKEEDVFDAEKRKEVATQTRAIWLLHRQADSLLEAEGLPQVMPV